jgi:hypothetical protein
MSSKRVMFCRFTVARYWHFIWFSSSTAPTTSGSVERLEKLWPLECIFALATDFEDLGVP